ncbi:hypothetical protein ACHQM5_026207 [Ranunculus cassubicifolius]
MAISIQDLDTSLTTHTTHTVTLYDDTIHTTVTHTPSIVDQFLSEILYIHRFRLHRLVVGLDVEWRPNFGRGYNNPVATLQLCIGRRCLIFQLLYTSFIPQSLANFLSNDTYQFVGVGINGDVQKLMADYNLWVENTTDLRGLAAEQLQWDQLKNAGLKDLAMEVLGMDIVKPKNVTLSRWDAEYLDDGQIAYACVDAFVSFEMGRKLIWGN